MAESISPTSNVREVPMKISGFIAVERLPKITQPDIKCRHHVAVGIAPTIQPDGSAKNSKFYLHATKGWRKA